VTLIKRIGDAWVSSKTHLKALWRVIVSLVLVVLCFGISNQGVQSAVGSCNAAEGQRGGAIAVMIAIAVIFLTPSYASRLHRRLSKKVVAPAPIDTGTLLAILDEDATFARFQNVLFAVATLIGTLYWGFGDKFAQKAISALPNCKS
jgi:hypothetical protein